MTDVQLPSELLLSIVQVLERVEGNLEKLDKHFERLETLHSLDPFEKRGYVQTHLVYDERIPEQAPLKENPTSDASVKHHSATGRVRYYDWGINSRSLRFEGEVISMLQKYLGDYWRIPRDNRLPLLFFKGTADSENQWDSQVAIYSTRGPNIEVRLDLLRRFDAQLRIEKGNDFLVIDYDLMNNTRMYRMGEVATGTELMVDPLQIGNAPWSRLILYQGMTTGNSINPNNKKIQESLPPIPYFGREDTGTGLWTHIFSHLRLKPRDITTNPYLDAGAGFHTTFYEIRKDRHLQVNELWKQGPLYDHPLGWYFRKSAYTLYVPTSGDTISGETGDLTDLNRHWTILLLAPDYFFNQNNTSFPMKALPAGRAAQALGHRLGRLTRQGAEMNLIGQGLERISERWAAFQSYFDYILDGGDSLMQPTEHDNLLFDDETFSRSRRYFWAIDCLSEFESSISDNILQWELYKKARITPLFPSQVLPELDFIQFRNAERQYHILQNQREYFRQKLALTKALRDALFNASAVIESRASTRLGENVKILTFVSIFFLPLSFCTSLWSVNDKFATRSLVIVIIIVALATYFTVFNVNSLVYTFSRLYTSKKRRVVQKMKLDQDPSWKRRGQRFEVFRPKHENPQPSEWYVTLYAMLNPALMLGLRRPRGAEGKKKIGFLQSLTSFFSRGRKMEATEPELVNDQPWVL